MTTKDEVLAALAEPPKARADGKYICQVCKEPFRKQAIGPHQIKHRREVGLIDQTERILMPKGVKIQCPVCSNLYKPHSIPDHLRRVHEFDHNASVNESQRLRREFVANLANGRQPSREVAMVHANGDEPEIESVFREISAVDAATNILTAARKDGLVPIKLLPDIFEWVVETGKMLHRLERMSG